ncbi:hypothetical protein [Pedobacter sp. MW01-1-1]|uniref:hypothetical protein n=1 Tax=Pedobacter sp. MW01-1-1 TaxID=3383027 RepID=UPI003FEF3C37
MKKYLIVLLFSLITSLTFGQSQYQDVVYLKNGSILRGIIIEQIPNKSLKIETADKNVFVYQFDEIDKITKEQAKNQSKNSTYSTNFKKGYKGIAEVGYQIGVGTYKMDRLKVNIINGYQFSPYLYAGIGTGIRQYFDAKATLIPVFADFRAKIIDKDIAPYIAMGIGYSFNTKDSFGNGGFLINPTVGASFKVSKRNSLNLAAGYDLQKLKVYNYYYAEYGILRYNASNENFGAIDITLGFTF